MMMNAAVYNEYGTPDVLHLATVAKPVPKDNQILIRIRAASVNYGDLLARNFKNTPEAFNMPSLFWLPALLTFGVNKPKKPILGAELAGDVEAVGKNVTRFKVGDAVFAYPADSFGAYAEYICMDEGGLVALKPSNVSYDEAATIPYGALTAYSILSKGEIQAGQKVLINGASGAIGSAAVQIAKALGAEVTGVCSTARMDYVRSLGADHVIDYTKTRFYENGETYDLILDVLGKSTFSQCKGALKSGGRYLLASFKLRRVLQMLWTARQDKRVICVLSSYAQADLEAVRAAVEAGTIKAVVDRRFSLGDVASAHAYIEGGQRQGAVVITM